MGFEEVQAGTPTIVRFVFRKFPLNITKYENLKMINVRLFVGTF